MRWNNTRTRFAMLGLILATRAFAWWLRGATVAVYWEARGVGAESRWRGKWVAQNGRQINCATSAVAMAVSMLTPPPQIYTPPIFIPPWPYWAFCRNVYPGVYILGGGGGYLWEPTNLIRRPPLPCSGPSFVRCGPHLWSDWQELLCNPQVSDAPHYHRGAGGSALWEGPVPAPTCPLCPALGPISGPLASVSCTVVARP